MFKAEPTKSWVALSILAAAAIILLMAKIYVAGFAFAFIIFRLVSCTLVIISVFVISDGFSSLSKTPVNIFRDICARRTKRHTPLQWICMILAIVLLVFVI